MPELNLVGSESIVRSGLLPLEKELKDFSRHENSKRESHKGNGQ